MSQFRDALIREVITRLYEESAPRIIKCLNQLAEEDIWWRPNASSNSVGNLVLHLCGNVKQWIYAGLGGNADHRKRQTEFDAIEGLTRKQLTDLLEETMALIKPVIEQLPESELLRKRPVQTFEETGLSILVHVTEHFSYHTGQIAYIAKMRSGRQLGFYEGVSLD